MKALFFSLFLMSHTLQIPDYWTRYKEAAQSEKKALEWLGFLEKIPNPKPIEIGYKGATYMLMAKYSLNPYTKLSQFRKGSQVLEKSIELDKNNIELRLLRYAIQRNAPTFLGYNKAIEADQAFLIKHVEEVKKTSLYEEINRQLKQYK